jgi:hypothetical protein
MSTAAGAARAATPGAPTAERVWRELTRASFAVVSHVTPAGEPRSSGVLYTVIEHRLYAVVAPDGWKARHIAADGRVAVTVPVRRGGIMALVFPIPPATISFHGRAVVHREGSSAAGSVATGLAGLIPPERLGSARVLEIVPEGEFVTYGVGVPLLRMRDPAIARGRAPVG